MPPPTKKPIIHADYRSHPYSKKSTPLDMTSQTSPNPARATASPWNPEDDARLVEARKQGLNWEPIAKQYFPTKTANACRKRHERLMDKRQTTEDWDSAKLEAMAIAYVRLRERIWKILAEEIGEKWQAVETKVSVSLLFCLEDADVNLSVWKKVLRI